MRRLAQTITGKGHRGGRQAPRRTPYRRLQLERLEDRLAPATNITVITGGVGSLDHFLSASNGTITTANDPGDTAATLSVGALQGVGPGVNIGIAADATIHFNDLGTLALQTGSGHSVTFTTTTGTLGFANAGNTVSTAGASLTFSAGTDLTVSNLNTNGGDVSLTAGTTGPAGAGGDLQFESILTNGGGNLTFQATAGTSNGGAITQSGSGSAASGQAINATADGNISVNSLRGSTDDLTSNSGSISTSGTDAVQASAELTLSAHSGITLNTLAASLQATNNALGGIFITQLASPAQTLTVTGSGVVNNANGGPISLDNLGAGIVLDSGVNVQTINGAITLAGTDLQIDGLVNSGAARTTLTTSKTGEAIDLGTNTSGDVGLTNAELANVTAGGLTVGSAAAGTINVSAAITAPAGWTDLSLVNSGSITEAPAGSLGVPNLRIISTGPVSLLSANHVGTLAANTTNAFSFNDGTNTLTVGIVDGVTGITTSGSDIHLIADDMDLAQQVSTGSTSAGVVNLEPFTTTRLIALGAGGGALLLDNGELNEVTAGVLRIGSNSFSGNININTAISPANIGALSLITTGTGILNQAGNPITVARGSGGLAVQAATPPFLVAPTNDVGALAAAISGAGNNFEFTNSAGFTVSTVDGVAGISTATGTTETVVLTAGGSVSQNTGANITSQNLLLLGTGGYTLTEIGNDVATLAASVTNAVSYTDANDLTVGSVTNPAGGFTTHGVTSTSGSVSVATVAGGLTVSNNVIASTTASLTAGSTVAIPDQFLTNNATITGASATLTADHMALDSGIINVGTGATNIVTLQPDTSSRTIDLGGTGDPTGTLQISQSELNTITAGIVRVGSTTAGNLTVTAAITAPSGTAGGNPGVWGTLSLLSGGQITQNTADTLTVTNLNAVGNTGVTLNLANVVSTLAGATVSGEFNFADSTNLTVDNVDSGLGSGLGSGILTDGQVVNLDVATGSDSLTINQAIDTTHNFGTPAPGGANVFLYADNMALNNNSSFSTINAGTGGALALSTITASNTIAVGGADATNTLGIDDNDLSNVTAAVVRIGGSAQTGAITVDGTINRHAGFNTLDLIATGSGGAITQTTGSIAVANLALQADAGIGSATAIQVVGPINLVYKNLSSNNVQITSTGALTIATVDGLNISKNTGGAVTLTANSPLTFAADAFSNTTFTATTTETASESMTPLPSPDDDITVNANVTVSTSGGNLTFTSGDSIVTGAGSLVSAANGTVSLTAGQGDTDNDAVMTLNGSLSGTSITLSSPGNVGVNGLTATSTISVTSTSGAILDVGDSTDGTDITAPTVTLSAATGIGVNGPGVVSASDAALEIQASTLSFSNSTSGDVNIINVSGDLSASGSNSASGGQINLSEASGSTLTINASNLSSTNGNISLSADALTLTGTINAGTGIVTLQQADTTTRNIDLGLGTTAGDLDISDTELSQITAGILRIGSTGNAGTITVTGPVTTHAGFSTLDLLSGAGVSETGTGSLTVTSLAVQSSSTILLAGANAVSNVAVGGSPVLVGFKDSLSLTVTTVDGVSGISAAGNVNLLSSVADTALTVSQAVTTNGGFEITFAFDNMTLGASVTATGGSVFLEPFSTGQLIDIGGSNAAGTLGLTKTELNEITADTLQIGAPTSSDITISDAITLTTVTTLALVTGGGITQNSGDTLTVANLALRAANAVTLTEANDVTTGVLSANVSGSGQAFNFTDVNALTIGTADGLAGITTNGGAITVKAMAGDLTVNNNISAGAATITLITDGTGNLFTNNAVISNSGGNTVSIVADLMSLDGTPGTSAITASGALVFLDVATAGRGVSLGANPLSGTLALSQNDLNTITAGKLRIGDLDGTVGLIKVTGAITDAGTGWSTLELISDDLSGTKMSQDTGASLTVTNLVAVDASGVTLNDPGNTVSVLAGGAANRSFSFVNSTSLTVGSVDVSVGAGLGVGIQTVGEGSPTGDISVTALGSGSTLTVSNRIDTTFLGGTGANITLTADAMALNAAINGPGSIVTLQQGGTTSRAIDVGLGTTANALDLSTAALANVTASTLRIGRGDNAGNLSVTAALSSPGGASTLDLLSGGSISQTSGSTITVTNLAAQGAGGVSLGETNSVSNLAGTTTNNTFTFTNGGGTLNVGNSVDGISNIDAGTGDVNLTVGTTTPAATSILIDTTNNGGSAVVTGGTVTLTALGTTDGATGQIGFFSGGAKFFEVSATTINASTDNSRAWIAAIGGAAVGSVNVGTETVFLKTVNGDLTSTHAGSTPDVTAATVNLLSPGTTGSFGTSSNPLLVQTSTLKASLTGTGSINVTNVAAGGNLSVTAATTTSGAINLGVAGGNLTTAASTGTDISAPGNTVTLTVSGNVVSGTAVGVTDVGAANLAISGTGSTSGIGTLANPLKTAASTFAASVSNGGVFVTNTGDLTLGTVGTLNGVSATGGVINISTTGALTLPAGSSVQDPTGAVTLTAGTNNTSVLITLSGLVTGSPVNIYGGAGNDTFNINLAAGSSATVTIIAVPAGSVASDNDTFNVTPSSGTTYFIFGSDGTANTEATPGDTLNINLTGTTGGDLSIASQGGDDLAGGYGFSNRAAVNFGALDVVNPPAPFPLPTPPAASTSTASSTSVSVPALTAGAFFDVAVDAYFAVSGFFGGNLFGFYGEIQNFDLLLASFFPGITQGDLNRIALDAYLMVTGAATGDSAAFFGGLDDLELAAISLPSTAATQLVNAFLVDLYTFVVPA